RFKFKIIIHPIIRIITSLLHFLKCALSRPVPPCVPVVTCFIVNLHFLGGKFLELELLPPFLLFFLFDIGFLPLFLSKFMFKFKIIIYYEKQAR
ncbi:hypothetical protein H5410_052495, partial [Solanum commersonii]